MVNYRRFKQPGATYFFTVTLINRQSTILIEHIELLKKAMKQVKNNFPYTTDAIVVLPDHIHTIWTLPEGDDNFSIRWMKIKYNFTRSLIKQGVILNRNKKGEYMLWQRRFWEYFIRNDKDYENHVNYIHYNPVKHGHVLLPRDWPFSSFHRFVKQGIYPLNWSDSTYDTLNYSVGHGME